MELDEFNDASGYDLALIKAEDRAEKIRKNNELTHKEKKKLLASNAIRFELEAK